MVGRKRGSKEQKCNHRTLSFHIFKFHLLSACLQKCVEIMSCFPTLAFNGMRHGREPSIIHNVTIHATRHYETRATVRGHMDAFRKCGDL